MGHRRRRRSRSEKPKASVDMTSLIDLTFLLLVTFIVTLPALEGAIQIKLPEEKVNTPPPTKTAKLISFQSMSIGKYFSRISP
jgi:biopolymer transport protein ExbD